MVERVVGVACVAELFVVCLRSTFVFGWFLGEFRSVHESYVNGITLILVASRLG